MIKAGIVGGAGYTAGELIRLLIHHPKVEIDFIYSTSNSENHVGKVHQDLIYSNLFFSKKINKTVDVVFLCLGHGHSKDFLNKNIFDKNTKIIDLSNDFRLKNNRNFQGREFIYGLPELNKSKIKQAQNIANPGCFATAIQLAILPLADKGLLCNDLHVNAVTGATGAGTGLSPTSHFAWRDNNFSYYKPFIHQHLGEISESLQFLQNDFKNDILFLPNRGNFSRGIFATFYVSLPQKSLENCQKMYADFYRGATFVKMNSEPLHLKQVVNTNYGYIHLHKYNNKLLVTSVIDNLLKGASGQAIQNLNLMLDFEETEGLNLKGSYF